MKKNLLSALAICGILFTASAQNFNDGDTGYLIDYSGTDATSPNCLSNLALPNNGGYQITGGNIATNNGEIQNGSEKYLSFTAATGTLDGSTPPAFYDIYSTTNTNCNPMRTDNVSIDMSANPTISIRAKSDVNGAVLRVWIATYGSTTYSTYNTGAGVSIPFDITLSTSWQTFNFNFSTADATNWAAWDGSASTGCNCTINMLGFTATTSGATYMISQIGLGSMSSSVVAGTTGAILPASVKYYPNPASNVINVENTNVSSLKLMNVNGAVVKESTTSSISVEGLTSGMYFLQINNYKPVKVAVK